MRAYHVRINMGTGEMFCERCGDRYTINLPANLDLVIAAARSYGKTHDRCKPQVAIDARLTPSPAKSASDRPPSAKSRSAGRKRRRP